MVLGQGVKADPQKIVAMLSWLISTIVKALRGFMDLTGYCRKFIKGCRSIAKPLTWLLKKEGFHWDDLAKRAFKELKGP